MTNPMWTGLLVACALVGAPRTQGPEETVKKILHEVAEEMREIDRLLLSSSQREAREALERGAAGLQKLIDQTRDSQGRVVRGIDRLIEELQSMQQSRQRQQQSQQEPQDGQPQDGQQRPQDSSEPGSRRDGRRQENQTPDIAQQPQPDRQEPGRQDRPTDPSADPLSQGQNVRSGAQQPDGSEKVDREGVDGSWGDLPKYVHFLHSRGGVPDVPEKYRRLVEAYQKQAHTRK
jgi:hypothetical protein